MHQTMHRSSECLHESPRPRLQLAKAGPHEAPRGDDYPPHSDHCWELIYYRAGSIDSVVGGEVLPGRPGVLLTIPPGIVHAERASTAYSNFWIQVEAPEHQPWPRVCYDDEHGTFGHVCAALVREWRGRALGREAMVGLLLEQLDVLLQRAHDQAGMAAGERLVREAERLLEERSRRPVSIKAIADEIGVSPSCLRAQFARRRGRPPMAILQDVRVQHALGLLRNSNAPLETIASACGYDSASHLSRHVKRVTGKSPGALRAGVSSGG